VARGDPQTDAEVLAVSAIEPEAFGVFYRRHLRAVLAYLLHRTRRSDLAADLTAETFAAALEGAPRFRPPGGHASARPWLFGIAADKLADSARRGRVAAQARRALGMPAWTLADDELERAEELADARRLAGRPTPRAAHRGASSSPTPRTAAAVRSTRRRWSATAPAASTPCSACSAN
jgi:RNA polymerase sigma-70 factor (ECF subfamily)